MEINKAIFKGYDISGEYGKDLTEEVAVLIGKAYANNLLKLGKKRVIVGMDNRKSSPMLKAALISGILESGVNVIDIGLVTTPMLYYANEFFKVPSGIIVTSSHNLEKYNGFKIIFDKQGEICKEEIQEFKELVLKTKLQKSCKLGKYTKVNISKPYTNMLYQKFEFSKKIKIVVDTGNGTATTIANKVFDKFSIDGQLSVKYISDKSNLDYLEPTKRENLEILIDTVIIEKADLGILYDADADRVGFVDEKGNILNMDQMLAIFSRFILPKTNSKKIFFDVGCSKLLSDEIRRYGGIPCMYKTGSSYIKRAMKENESAFGGEISGHTFFNDGSFIFDDGIYASLKMIEILDKSNKNLSILKSNLNMYHSSPLVKINVKEESKEKIIQEFKNRCKKLNYIFNDIDGVRIEFDYGFVLLRMSNTMPEINLRFEGYTKLIAEDLKRIFIPIIIDIINEVNN